MKMFVIIALICLPLNVYAVDIICGRVMYENVTEIKFKKNSHIESFRDSDNLLIEDTAEFPLDNCIILK